MYFWVGENRFHDGSLANLVGNRVTSTDAVQNLGSFDEMPELVIPLTSLPEISLSTVRLVGVITALCCVIAQAGQIESLQELVGRLTSQQKQQFDLASQALLAVRQRFLAIAEKKERPISSRSGLQVH